MRVSISKFDENCNRDVKIKIDNDDLFNLNGTLALIVVPCLEKLKTNKRGFPFVDNEDLPKQMHRFDENTYNSDDDNKKRWFWIVDEMIWTFKQYVDRDWDKQYHTGTIDLVYDAAHDSIIQGSNHTHRIDSEGIANHTIRMQNGLRLFAKYYDNLYT